MVSWFRWMGRGQVMLRCRNSREAGVRHLRVRCHFIWSVPLTAVMGQRARDNLLHWPATASSRTLPLGQLVRPLEYRPTPQGYPTTDTPAFAPG